MCNYHPLFFVSPFVLCIVSSLLNSANFHCNHFFFFVYFLSTRHTIDAYLIRQQRICLTIVFVCACTRVRGCTRSPSSFHSSTCFPPSIEFRDFVNTTHTHTPTCTCATMRISFEFCWSHVYVHTHTHTYKVSVDEKLFFGWSVLRVRCVCSWIHSNHLILHFF